MTDVYGNITEGTSHNVFIVTDGIIHTPLDRSVLGGISREVVLELAAKLGVETSKEDLQPYDIFTADECLFSGTSFSVLPVVQVDGRPIGDGTPGCMVKQLLASWSEEVGIDIVDQAIRAVSKS